MEPRLLSFLLLLADGGRGDAVRRKEVMMA